MKLLQELDELRGYALCCIDSDNLESDIYSGLKAQRKLIFDRDATDEDCAEYLAALHNAYPELKKRIKELEARLEAAKGWLENILENDWKLAGYNTPENNYQVVSLLDAIGESK